MLLAFKEDPNHFSEATILTVFKNYVLIRRAWGKWHVKSKHVCIFPLEMPDKYKKILIKYIKTHNNEQNKYCKNGMKLE